ncbi:tetraspanin-33-like [Saccoglossus kowalevskii]|uniref:Tetraspanin n=1 Tax=Saccoglossus kowalevskii TaxID=10224 RepID=A0ABM0GXX9_SACKO|nr:PREDICTED: tetraspanin-33-like [Saccoglossus kowalevskii]
MVNRRTNYNTQTGTDILDGTWCQCQFWVKYCLFMINILVWIISIIFISVGVWARVEKNQLGDLSTIHTDPAVLLIIAGSCMFVIAFLGFIGAIRENCCLLTTFLFLVILIFLFQIIIGVMALVFRDDVHNEVVGLVYDAIVSYRDDLDLQNAIDFVQTKLKCCGGISYVDWEHNIYFNCSSPGPSSCGVPWSCCRSVDMNSQCGYDIKNKPYIELLSTIYIGGCIDSLINWIEEHMSTIGSLAFCMGLFELFAIFLSHTMIQQIKAVTAEIDAEIAMMRAAPDRRMLY